MNKVYDLDARSVPFNPEASEPDENARPPAFTEEALALRFADVHRDRLRYVAVWSRWLIYEGLTWAIDDTLRAFDLSRVICREASSNCNNKKTAAAIATAKIVAAVERLAKADRRIAATVAQWDPDDFLFNTISGEADDH